MLIRDADGTLHSIWPAIERRDLELDDAVRWGVREARSRGGREVRFDVLDDRAGVCLMRNGRLKP